MFLYYIKLAEDLLKILVFLKESPIGPLVLLDFRIAQFVLVENSLTLSDVDDIVLANVNDSYCVFLLKENANTINKERIVFINDLPSQSRKNSPLSLTVVERQTCSQIAADKANLQNAHLQVLRYLLSPGVPQEFSQKIQELLQSLSKTELDSTTYLKKIQELKLFN